MENPENMKRWNAPISPESQAGETPGVSESATEQADGMRRKEAAGSFKEFFKVQAHSGFEQYPRLKKSFEQLKDSLTDVGFDEGEQSEALDVALKTLDRTEAGAGLKEISRILKSAVIEGVSERLATLGSGDKIRLTQLERAMEAFYIRMLEVLATFRKQTREHLASHRARSSKVGEVFAFQGPELSLPAIQNALRSGVKMIELDIVALGDGTPVVSHDLFARTGKTKVNIHNIPNIAEAEKMSATVNRTDAPIYPLENLLQFFKQYKGLAQLNIEVKSEQALPKLIDLIQQYELQQDVIVSSFNPKVLIDIHEALPNVTLAMNTFVTEFNVETILLQNAPPSAPFVLPGGIALGGTELPPEDQRALLATHFRTLPRELRDILSATHGYISVQLPTAKFGFGTEALQRLATRAKEENIRLLMFRVSPAQAAILKNNIDLLHLESEKVTYKRMLPP